MVRYLAPCGWNTYPHANPLKDYRLGETSVFTLKNADNTELYCRLIKPADFDAARRYPVIIYVYGGPHSQLITNSWPYPRDSE